MGSEKTTKFKIGDKIKVVGEVFWANKYFTNKTGEVVKIQDPICSFPYLISINREEIPVYEYEIEFAIRIGQQLLFTFME